MVAMDPVRKRLVRQHAANGVILDTNILVIYLVGRFDENQVERFLPGAKGTAVYFPEDFKLISDLTEEVGAKKFIVTPHILAEVSNLTFNHFKEPKLKEYIEAALNFLRTTEEVPSKMDELIDLYHLPIIGFTDSSIVEAAKAGYLVITEDVKCMAILERENCCVLNINHLRTAVL